MGEHSRSISKYDRALGADSTVLHTRQFSFGVRMMIWDIVVEPDRGRLPDECEIVLEYTGSVDVNVLRVTHAKIVSVADISWADIHVPDGMYKSTARRWIHINACHTRANFKLKLI